MVATFEYGCLDTCPNFLALWNIYIWTVPHSPLHHSLSLLPSSRGLDVVVVLGVFAGTAWSRLHACPPMSQLYGPSDSLCDIFLESKLP